MILTCFCSLLIVLCMRLVVRRLISTSVPKLTHSSFQMRNGHASRILLIFSKYPSFLCCCFNTNFWLCISMLTSTSKRSQVRIFPVSILLFQRWRNCTKHGTAAVPARSTLRFLMGCRLQLRRLRSTITRLQLHMRTHLLCVCVVSLSIANAH